MSSPPAQELREFLLDFRFASFKSPTQTPSGLIFLIFRMVLRLELVALVWEILDLPLLDLWFPNFGNIISNIFQKLVLQTDIDKLLSKLQAEVIWSNLIFN